MDISIEEKAKYRKQIQAGLEDLQAAESELEKSKRKLEDHLALDPESQSKTVLNSIVESKRAIIAAILKTVLIIASRFDNDEDLGFNREHFFEKYFRACLDAGQEPDIHHYIEYLCKQESRSKSDIIEIFKKYPPASFADYKNIICKISKLYPDLLIEDFPQFAVLYAIWPPCEKNRYLIPVPEQHEQAMAALVAHLEGARKKIPPELSYEGDWYSETRDAGLLLSLKKFQNETESEATILDDIIEEDQWLKAFWIYQEYADPYEDEDTDELHQRWKSNETDYSRSFECAKNEDIDSWYRILSDIDRMQLMQFILGKINRKNNHFAEQISASVSAQISEFTFEVLRALVKFCDHPLGPTELYDLTSDEEEELTKKTFRACRGVDFDLNKSIFAIRAYNLCDEFQWTRPLGFQFKDYVTWDWIDPAAISRFWIEWVNKFYGSIHDQKALIGLRFTEALPLLDWLDYARDYNQLIKIANQLASHPDSLIATNALEKLSDCSLNGNGMLRSKKKALAYLLVAKVTDEQGHKTYAEILPEQISDLEDEMSQEQIGLAEELAEKIYEELSS